MIQGPFILGELKVNCSNIFCLLVPVWLASIFLSIVNLTTVAHGAACFSHILRSGVEEYGDIFEDGSEKMTVSHGKVHKYFGE
jgi:hypothetical protein